MQEYVASKPNNWSSEEFSYQTWPSNVSERPPDLTKAITRAASDPANYRERIQDLVDTLDANKKEALAEYVLHRKSVIELVEAARKFGGDGKRAPEDVIHELVFRRFTDNVALGYFEHNLWLIDDALAFLPYITSDRTLHGGRRKKDDKITDIAFFDDSMVLGDNDGTTITIVEFKKPSRNDYIFGPAESDPVRQVISTLDRAVAQGGVSKTDGTHFAFAGVIRRFAFIIADHTQSLVQVLQMHDFKNEWNPRLFCQISGQ